MKDRCLPLGSFPRNLVCAALLAVCAAGCGGDSDAPTRYDVSGNITFDGQPVPYGMIVFEDKKTGYKTACSIDDGYYESQSGKGHQGGKFSVNITGFADAGSGGAEGKRLWNGAWKTEIELPAESTTMDFDVPKAEVQVPAGGQEGGNPLDET